MQYNKITINTITKDTELETSKTGWIVSSVHLDSDLLQEEVDSPVDVPIAVVKGHHTLILIFACNFHELGHKHNQRQSNSCMYNKIHKPFRELRMEIRNIKHKEFIFIQVAYQSLQQNSMRISEPRIIMIRAGYR